MRRGTGRRVREPPARRATARRRHPGESPDHSRAPVHVVHLVARCTDGARHPAVRRDGGVLSLLLTGTPFSISPAVGFTSALGVGTLGGCVFLSGIRRVERQEPGAGQGSSVPPPWEAIQQGAMLELRPVLMACLAAGLGLLPAAVSNGIGVQAQRPLARVVVGAMITTALAIL